MDASTKRKRGRRTNETNAKMLITQRTARNVSLDEITELLHRLKYRKSRSTINRLERKENPPGAFREKYLQALNLETDYLKDLDTFNLPDDLEVLVESNIKWPGNEFAPSMVPSHVLENDQQIEAAAIYLLTQARAPDLPRGRITLIVSQRAKHIVNSNKVVGLLKNLAQRHEIISVWPHTELTDPHALHSAMLRLLFSLAGVKIEHSIRTTQTTIGFDALVIDGVGIMVLPNADLAKPQPTISHGWFISRQGYIEAFGKNKTIRAYNQQNIQRLKDTPEKENLAKMAKAGTNTVVFGHLVDVSFGAPFEIYRAISQLIIDLAKPLLTYRNAFDDKEWIAWEEEMIKYERLFDTSSYLFKPFLSTLTYPEDLLLDENSDWFQRTKAKFLVPVDSTELMAIENTQRIAKSRIKRLQVFKQKVKKHRVRHVYLLPALNHWVEYHERFDGKKTKEKDEISEVKARLQSLYRLLKENPLFEVAFVSQPHLLERLKWPEEAKAMETSSMIEWQVRGEHSRIEARLNDPDQNGFMHRRTTEFVNRPLSNILRSFADELWNGFDDSEKNKPDVLEHIANWLTQLR